MKKHILVFGDSNTWGWRPDNDPLISIDRWSDEERWTGVLQAELGDGYQVITEGLNARTTTLEDPIEEERCGKVQMLPIMDSHAPLDLMVIFLGSNDLKNRFSVSPWEIAQGAGLLVKKALAQRNAFAGEPKVLLMAPPRLGDAIYKSCHVAFWGNEEKSTQLGMWYRKVAEQMGVGFLDTDQIVSASKLDGLHLDKDQHEILGKAVAVKIRDIMEEDIL